MDCVHHNFIEATMLKFFSKSATTPPMAEEALELANITLLERMSQVLQAASRNQEKYSTITNLKPLAG
jgi:hypothetical protein